MNIQAQFVLIQHSIKNIYKDNTLLQTICTDIADHIAKSLPSGMSIIEQWPESVDGYTEFNFCIKHPLLVKYTYDVRVSIRFAYDEPTASDIKIVIDQEDDGVCHTFGDYTLSFKQFADIHHSIFSDAIDHFLNNGVYAKIKDTQFPVVFAEQNKDTFTKIADHFEAIIRLLYQAHAQLMVTDFSDSKTPFYLVPKDARPSAKASTPQFIKFPKLALYVPYIVLTPTYPHIDCSETLKKG
jgi:hypothetical protein